jgi:hypothetical protein
LPIDVRTVDGRWQTEDPVRGHRTGQRCVLPGDQGPVDVVLTRANGTSWPSQRPPEHRGTSRDEPECAQRGGTSDAVWLESGLGLVRPDRVLRPAAEGSVDRDLGVAGGDERLLQTHDRRAVVAELQELGRPVGSGGLAEHRGSELVRDLDGHA